MKSDAVGRRVWKVSGSQSVSYSYDLQGRQTVIIDNSNNSTLSWSLYFNGQRLGTWTDRTDSKRRDAGGVSSHYYPYGEEITSTGNDTQNYAESYRDSDSVLHYAQAR